MISAQLSTILNIIYKCSKPFENSVKPFWFSTLVVNELNITDIKLVYCDDKFKDNKLLKMCLTSTEAKYNSNCCSNLRYKIRELPS